MNLINEFINSGIWCCKRFTTDSLQSINCSPSQRFTFIHQLLRLQVVDQNRVLLPSSEPPLGPAFSIFGDPASSSGPVLVHDEDQGSPDPAGLRSTVHHRRLGTCEGLLELLVVAHGPNHPAGRQRLEEAGGWGYCEVGVACAHLYFGGLWAPFWICSRAASGL